MKQGIHTIPASVAEAFAEHIAAGLLYAGVLLGVGDEPAQHVFLLPESAKNLSWADAKAWSESVSGELPTRREQSLLFANLKEEFEEDWYWSCEQHADDADFAWGQYFLYGDQDGGHESYARRARAVRRLPI